MSEQTPVYTTPECPLWVDTTNSSFNVDDPTFWTPMPVISGLASGFCERMAVAKIASAGGTVESGAKATLVTGKTWTIGATTDPALGSNNAIVSNVAHGFATGTTGATLYNTHDASFQTVGTSAGANYMKAVDDAITSMVTMQSSYVNANGAAYSFTTLANAAVTRAAASGSSIQTPVKDGTNSNAPFAPAYPVEWAKERKWMLDELRYTGTIGTTPLTLSHICYDTVKTTVYGTYNISSSTVEGTKNAISAAYITGVTAYNEVNIIGMTAGGKLYDNYGGPYFPYKRVAGNVISAPAQNQEDRLPYAVGVYDDTTTVATTDRVVAYCGEVNYANEDFIIWNEAGATKITAGPEYNVTAGGKYVVTNNTTVLLTGNGTVGVVSISAGCVAKIDEDLHIPDLNIMAGGMVECEGAVADTTYNLHTSRLYYDYRPVASASMATSYIYNPSAATAIVADGPSYYIKGATLSLDASHTATNIIIRATAGVSPQPGILKLADGAAGTIMSGAAVVLSGGTVYASNTTKPTGNANITELTVLSGGVATLTRAIVGSIKVHSGGIANLTSCSVNRLGILDGATVNITGATTSAKELVDYNDILVGTFEPFSLSEITSGWHTYDVDRVGTAEIAGGTVNVAYIAGSTNSADLAGATVYNNLPRVAGTIVGMDASVALTLLNNVETWKNFCVLAINGGTATGGLENHYKDFRVRQYDSYDQSETPQT